jgi:hypothetical protein
VPTVGLSLKNKDSLQGMARIKTQERESLSALPARGIQAGRIICMTWAKERFHRNGFG